MTAAYIQPGPVAHMRYDAGHRKPNKGVTIAIAVTALVHGAIFAALVTARFTPILQNYVDDKTDVLLTHTPEAPPPPPVKAPPVKEHTAPPVVQPRPPANIDSSFAAPPPLYIAPVETPRPQVAGPPVAAAAPAPVSAPAPARPTIIANPDWVSRPTADEVAKYYPERALRMSISGRATLLCKVSAKGAVGAGSRRACGAPPRSLLLPPIQVHTCTQRGCACALLPWGRARRESRPPL